MIKSSYNLPVTQSKTIIHLHEFLHHSSDDDCHEDADVVNNDSVINEIDRKWSTDGRMSNDIFADDGLLCHQW